MSRPTTGSADHAVGPDEDRRPAARADRAGGDRVDAPDRDRDAPGGRRLGAVVGREEREPGPEQVERRAPARGPDVRDPPPEVRVHLLLGRAARAARVGRAGGGVLRDRPALGLVAVQERVAGPAARDPGQLPAEVEAVVQREVQAGPAARRHAMGGVAGEQDGPRAEALRELRGGREAARPLDAHGQAGHARREPDELRGRARPALRGEQPAVGGAGGQQDAGRLAPGQRVEEVAVRADDVPQRRADQRRLADQHVVGAVHRDPRRAAHRALRAVGRDHVARLDGALRAGAHVAERGARATQRGDLRAEQHAVRGDLREEQRLDVVLRDAGRLDGAQDAALRPARVPDADRVARRGGRERLGLEHGEVDVRAARAHGVLQPPAAHQLHRAQAEDGRPRVRGQDAAALDEQRGDAVARELDRGREPGRPGAGDQDGDLHAREGGRAGRGA